MNAVITTNVTQTDKKVAVKILQKTVPSVLN